MRSFKTLIELTASGGKTQMRNGKVNCHEGKSHEKGLLRVLVFVAILIHNIPRNSPAY